MANIEKDIIDRENPTERDFKAKPFMPRKQIPDLGQEKLDGKRFFTEEFMQAEWVEINNTSFIKIFYVVFCTTFLVYLLNLYALKNLKATTVGMFIYLQPVIGILFAIYRGADKLTIPDISSVLLVFAGVYLVSKKTTKAT